MRPNSAKQCQTVPTVPEQCVLTPLGSPSGPQKRPYVHVPEVPRCMRWVCHGAGVRCRGVPGWVYRVGTREGIPGYYPAARGGSQIQRSGPRKAHGAWSGWYLGAGRTRYGDGGGTALDHPPGPVGPPWGPPCPGPCKCRLSAKRARFQSYFYKVSQNDEVSP